MILLFIFLFNLSILSFFLYFLLRSYNDKIHRYRVESRIRISTLMYGVTNIAVSTGMKVERRIHVSTLTILSILLRGYIDGTHICRAERQTRVYRVTIYVQGIERRILRGREQKERK
jgi:uncharacterized membrane protein YsdA (DUF1294 family)